MNNLKAILIIAAIMSIPTSLGFDQAFAGGGSPVTIGSVIIGEDCELQLTGGLDYGTLNPLNPESVEDSVNLSNGGNQNAVVTIEGTNWDDESSTPADVMLVGTTHYEVGTPAATSYASKTILVVSPGVSLTTVAPASSTDVTFQLTVALTAGNENYDGTLKQDVTFGFGCVSV